ncbi:MAG: Nudix family hydrolase [Gammaproteobacteria bacterium]|nr:Nudix family hydrolase [Gammaproteobacteria bacterium]
MFASTPITGRDGGLSPVPGGDPVHVAVGVVRNSRGEVLIARRLAGTHLAGLWEFPGGKLESGETPRDGLIRELREELGIDVAAAVPLIQVRHAYPEARVLLDVWEVSDFAGVPVGREGQPLRWIAADELATVAFPEPNKPIATAVRLPDCYAILEADQPFPELLMANLRRLADSGVRLIQCRAKALQAFPVFPAFAKGVVDYCHARGIRVLLNGDPVLARAIGADGVHLTAATLARLGQRPLDDGLWLAASCHDEAELLQAARIGVDFAVLGPVAATATHPGAVPLGWAQFADLVATVNFPVYALGGLGAKDLCRARHSGARGVAAVRAFLA